MSATPASTFTVGLVQMRSGLDPVANLDTAAKLIGEAKAGGADYVQTPEMTNIMELKRERLFAAIVAEETDPVSRRFASSPASSASIFTSARSPSSCRASAPPTAPS